MNEEQQQIWDHLNENAIGYDNRCSSSQIRNELGLESGGVTNEHVRDLIRDMILHHNCCIGSEMWASGYWIIQTEDELERACVSLENRAESIKERANALRETWQQENE